jgi:hypothetical protein
MKSLAMMTPPNHVADLAKIIDDATPADYAVLCGELERLKASLWLKMTIGTPSQAGAAQDQLLTAEDVATRLKVTKAFVYKNAAQYPFTVREGRYVRFSQQGLSRYLDKHQRR